jgi:long-chain acyl-CoA synthetase
LGHFNIGDVFRDSFLKIAGIYPFGHMSGTITLLAWVSEGHTLVIYESLDEEVILQSVEKYKINLLVLFPAFGHRLLDGDLKDKYDLSSLKFVTTGGSKFPENLAKGLIKKYNIKFSEGLCKI